MRRRNRPRFLRPWSSEKAPICYRVSATRGLTAGTTWKDGRCDNGVLPSYNTQQKPG